MKTRIYIVRTIGSEDDPLGTTLVCASHPSAALRHVADECFTVSVATQDELVYFIGEGLDVEGGAVSIQADDRQLTLPTC